MSPAQRTQVGFILCRPFLFLIMIPRANGPLFETKRKDRMLLLLAFVADCCWAQTVVYTTGQNGEISAYLVVNNTTDTTDSPSTSSRSSSSSPASMQAATASSLSITSISPTSSPSTIVLPNTPYSGQSLLTGT